MIAALNTPNAIELTNTTTHEESVFADALIKAIDAEGFNLELFRNVFLGFKGSILRPDVYIPAYGLVIEVNGSSHNTARGIAKDKANLEYYARLKLHVMEVSNEAVQDPEARTRLVNEVLTHLRNNPLDKRRRGLIRVNVCVGRKSVADKLRGDLGGLSHTRFFSEGALKGFKESPALGGSKFIFRKKRVSRAS